MINKPIALHRNERMWIHSGQWSDIWSEYLEQKSIPYEFVDLYQSDIIPKLDRYSAILWCIQNYVWADLMEARSVLRIAERKGIKVFPDQNTAWHFDDKIAEMYLFQAIKAPIPRSWVFYLLDDCVRWLKTEAKYPLVAKLRCGSGSSNVKLLRNADMAIRYAKCMFTKGLDPSPSLLYKAYSKAQSSRDWKTAIARIKKIPEFMNTRRHAKQMPVEKGYCYFQEFIPNDGFDIKVVVVGDKLSYFVRRARKGDYRASGGGDFFYDKKYMSKQIIDSAFEAAEAAELQCVGFDYVVDNRTGQGLIIEMCYGFDYEAVLQADGYWDRQGIWHNEPLDVPSEVIYNLLNR